MLIIGRALRHIHGAPSKRTKHAVAHCSGVDLCGTAILLCDDHAHCSTGPGDDRGRIGAASLLQHNRYLRRTIFTSLAFDIDAVVVGR
jgi:hypothetical protein